MRYRFYTCDVFTNIRFGGNPLAVFPNAEGLSTEQMQQITREFNYSESTFLFPAQQGNTRHVRIFTPTSEVPFAGHPNIGTAFVLASIGELGDFGESTNIVFEEKAGNVPITIRREGNKPIWCELKAPEAVTVGKQASPQQIASVLSLDVDQIVTTTHLPQVASVGLPFVMVELRDRQALERAQININALHELKEEGFPPDIHLYIHSNDEYNLRTRMFAPLDNVPEDPATGSANCALAGMLSHSNPAQDGAFQWLIAQGIEMKRPSVLHARTEKQDGRVTGVWIAGHCVMVSEGTLKID